MVTSRRKFNQEFKDELCREVIATPRPIKDVAEAYGVGAETLRNWVNRYRIAHGGEDAELSLPERARLKALEREVQDLRAEAAFLKKAALNSGSQRNGFDWGEESEAFSGSGVQPVCECVKVSLGVSAKVDAFR
jgi:transposase